MSASALSPTSLIPSTPQKARESSQPTPFSPTTFLNSYPMSPGSKESLRGRSIDLLSADPEVRAFLQEITSQYEADKKAFMQVAAQLDGQIRSLQSELSSVRISHSDELQVIEQEVFTARMKCASVEKKLAESNARIEELEALVAHGQANLERLQTKLNEESGHKAILGRQLEASTKQVEALEKIVSSSKAETKLLSEQIAVYEERLVALERQKEELSALNDNQRDDAARQIAEANAAAAAERHRARQLQLQNELQQSQLKRFEWEEHLRSNNPLVKFTPSFLIGCWTLFYPNPNH
jgi:chromosome segregation ATPase